MVGIPNSKNLAKVQVHVVDLSDEDGRYGFVKSGAIHVNCGSYREDEASHSFVHMVVFL